MERSPRTRGGCAQFVTEEKGFAHHQSARAKRAQTGAKENKNAGFAVFVQYVETAAVEAQRCSAETRSVHAGAYHDSEEAQLGAPEDLQGETE